MERSSQIQIGLLVLIAAMVGYYVFTRNSGNQTVRDQARTNLTNTSVTNNNAISAQDATKKEEVPTGPLTSIEFEEDVYDFGTVEDGEKVEHVYKFKNSGENPLIISDAKGSCGCTVPDWPKDPIAPGESGEMKVVFNTKGKPGKQTKQVTVKANTNPPTTIIKITGEVNKKPGSVNAAEAAKANDGGQPIKITPAKK